jgi:hypothetical protein
MGQRVHSMVGGIALGLLIGGSTLGVAAANPPVVSEAEIDQVVGDLKALGLAEARLVGDKEWPTVVAVGRARFERGEGSTAALNAALVASVEAKAAMVALLEGPEVAAAQRIASRLSSSDAEVTLVRRFESSVDVAIGGVLAGVEPRGIWIDEGQGLVEVAIQSVAGRWSAAREAIASYPSLAAAAQAVARAASEFAIVPSGGRLVRIGSGPEARLAVVGIGTSVLTPGKGTRAASLVAGRKAAVAAAAYLKGERVESKDSLSIMLETVERLDPTDRKSGEMQPEVKQRFDRTARSLTKGATPQGCETAEAELRILGDRVLVSVLAAPVAADSQ